jgi:hypothetical protein
MSHIEKITKTELLRAYVILASSVVLVLGLTYFMKTYFEDLVFERPTSEEITFAIETFDKEKLHRFIEFSNRVNRESAIEMHEILRSGIDVAFGLLGLIGALALNYVFVFKKIRKLSNDIAH